MKHMQKYEQPNNAFCTRKPQKQAFRNIKAQAIIAV